MAAQYSKTGLKATAPHAGHDLSGKVNAIYTMCVCVCDYIVSIIYMIYRTLYISPLNKLINANKRQEIDIARDRYRHKYKISKEWEGGF